MDTEVEDEEMDEENAVDDAVSPSTAFLSEVIKTAIVSNPQAENAFLALSRAGPSKTRELIASVRRGVKGGRNGGEPENRPSTSSGSESDLVSETHHNTFFLDVKS